MSEYHPNTKENTLMSSPTDIEKENLEAHVELCAERYKQLENRLTSIEGKVANLQDTIEESSLNTIKVLIGTAGTVIVGVLSMLAVIITKMP
jgi:chromosome segregation ATPase